MDDVDELYSLFPELKEQIVVEKKVGQGTFSYVYSAHFIKNQNEKIALKYIIPTSSPSRTKQEIECLLNSGGQDNVVGVLAVLRNKSHILILMPYIEHSAFHDSFMNWSLTDCKEYIKNLIIALNRVHTCGIIHRDVKPSNFLYDKEKNIFALVDFGLAQYFDKKSENIFEYESTTAKKGNPKIDTTPAKHMIALTKKGSRNSSSSLNNKKKSLLVANQKETDSAFNSPDKEMTQNTQNDIDNAMEKKELTLKNHNNSSSPFLHNQTNENNNQKAAPNIINKPHLTTNLQKYYSFQKSSYSMTENKCTCFNMPFVCEICTTRASKWAPRAGTAGFRAPEVLFRSTYQTPSVDIWSAGIIFLSILTGRYPFFKALDDNMAIMQLISLFGGESVRKAAQKYGESLVCSFDKRPMDIKDLCVGLRKNALKSCKNKSAEQKLIEFPDSAYDLLKKLLELDSDKRLSAEQALKHPFFINQ